MKTIEGLGIRLKELRNERDMSMDMVVYDINNRYNAGITKGHLSKWENEVNIPSLYHAKYLCLYYNVSLDYLIGLTKIKAPVRVLSKEAVRKGEEE